MVFFYRQLHVLDETYVINQVKEDICYVSNNFKNDMEISHKKFPENTIIKDYVLPDFTTIRRGFPLPLDQSTQNDNVRCFPSTISRILQNGVFICSIFLFSKNCD